MRLSFVRVEGDEDDVLLACREGRNAEVSAWCGMGERPCGGKFNVKVWPQSESFFVSAAVYPDCDVSVGQHTYDEIAAALSG